MNQMNTKNHSDWNRNGREIWSGDKHGLGQLVAIATSLPFAKLIEKSPSLLKATRLLLENAEKEDVWEHDISVISGFHEDKDCGMCYARVVLMEVGQ